MALLVNIEGIQNEIILMSMINFSIIIVTCNRHADLKICLESLLAQQARGDFSIEIIVADNNSSDATKEVAHSFMTKFRIMLVNTIVF